MKSLKKFVLLFFASLTFVPYQNCTPFETADLSSSSLVISNYSELFQKVIQPQCLSCHSSVSPSGNTDLSTYASTIASGKVVAGNALASSLYMTVFNGLTPAHATMTGNELAGLANWINNGALENEAPTVSAGLDKTVRLPASSTILDGSASDVDGVISNYSWTQLTGPNSAVLTNANTRSLTASNLIEGSYTFRLTATDNTGASANDSVSVSVTLSNNILPTVNAGNNRTIVLPTNMVSITGVASDSDGSISAYAWTQTSGPSTATLAGAATITLSATNLVQGTYVFNLEVTDNRSAKASDSISILVNPVPANVLPTVNAGADRTLVLPANSVSITATSADSDGTIASYSWSQVSGPSTAVLSGVTTITLSASSLIQGTYVFRISVTDNRGGIANDSISIIVSPSAPSAPTFTQLNNDIFIPLCSGCHSASNPRGGYNMSTFTALRTRVVVNNAAGSLLHQSVVNNSMPIGSPLSTADKNAIRDWINAGALNN